MAGSFSFGLSHIFFLVEILVKQFQVSSKVAIARKLALTLGITLGSVSLMVVGAGSASAGSTAVQSVPSQYLASVQKAAKSCANITAPLLAAQIEAESDWNPRAVSSIGAQGISQFLPGTWAEWGRDADHDGTNSPFDPQDAIDAQGRYMCEMIKEVMDPSSHLSGGILVMAWWAYNAGIQATIAAHGNAPTQEAGAYANRIVQLVPKYMP
ncbi:lytic transglycosylase domain-containing protein [Streptomyces sp. NPDC093509]|uniref:lytic transglycosylase domain-containing protein n=1 Tax=Streptomyces sp. NPDC093509 TaxID=3154982 RepID=UPI00344DB782